MRSRENGGVSWLWGLAFCLPCLVPLLVVALIAGGGAGAIGSFLSDNPLLVAIIALGVTVCALTMGLIVRRALYGTTGIRFLSKTD
jgi:hypothetical protein